MRAVRNQVTSFRPKWEVLPSVTTESAQENARYSGLLLDYFYKKSHIKRRIKEIVTHALVFSIGIWQFELDLNNYVVIRTIDPFDFYIDPNVRDADINDIKYGAEFVVKAINMPLSAIKTNPEYENTEDIQADNEVAVAEYKRFLLQVTQNANQRESKEAPMKMVYECWKREYQQDGTFKLRVVTFLKGSDKPLRNEMTDETEYPFEIYQGDLTPLQVYGESWIKHLIPINRVIDHLESHIFEYNHLFARGRFVVDKNSGVRVIVNQHGQIIEKNRGSTVTSLDISPLPAAPENQLARFRTYAEDISGAHDVSLGRIPAGVKSGVGIAELRQADATNQDDLVDNLEDFLSRAGSRILKLVAKNWNTSKLIQVTGLGGKADYFMAVGKKGAVSNEKKMKFGEMELPLATIGTDNEVRVQVGSWLAYTKEARQEKIKEFYRLGILDQETTLQHMEFGDIDTILANTRNERLMQLRGSNPNAATMQMTGENLSEEELALSENELMSEGKDVPVEPDDDHEVHISVHKEIMNDKEYGSIVKAHINEHIQQEKRNIRLRARTGPPVEGGGNVPPGAMGKVAAAGASAGAGGGEGGPPLGVPGGDNANVPTPGLEAFRGM